MSRPTRPREARPHAGPPGLDRREFLAAGAMAAAGSLLPLACATRPRNIVLFLTDDQHHRAIGYASGGRVRTPRLDALARSGTTFWSAYANALPCAPSRSSLLSGRYLFGRTPDEKVARLQTGAWTWVRALRSAGYRTGLIGKMHMNPVRADHGFAHAEYSEHAAGRRVAEGRPLEDDYEGWLAGFGLEDWQNTRRVPRRFREDYESFERNHWAQKWPYHERFHPISWTRDRSIAFLEQAGEAPEPFCLVTSFRYPHGPFNPAERFASLYDLADIEIPTDAWDDMRGLPQSLELVTHKGFYPRDTFQEDVLRRFLAFYFALVTQVDEAVGEIMRHIDPTETLVIFTSDHGEYLGERGRIGKHPWIPFEPVARVPFFALGAGFPAEHSVEAPIGLVDIAPTVLRTAGVAPPADLSGVALQDYLAGSRFGDDRFIHCQGQFDMTRRGPLKYFRGRRTSEEMLFDLSLDPGELVNLADEPEWQAAKTELAAEMRQALEA